METMKPAPVPPIHARHAGFHRTAPARLSHVSVGAGLQQAKWFKQSTAAIISRARKQVQQSQHDRARLAHSNARRAANSETLAEIGQLVDQLADMPAQRQHSDQAPTLGEILLRLKGVVSEKKATADIQAKYQRTIEQMTEQQKVLESQLSKLEEGLASTLDDVAAERQRADEAQRGWERAEQQLRDKEMPQKMPHQQVPNEKVTKDSLVRHSLPYKKNDPVNELWRRKEAEDKYEHEYEQRLQTEQQVMQYESLTNCLQEDLEDARMHAHAVEMVAEEVAQEAAAEVERIRVTQLTRILEDRNNEVEREARSASSTSSSHSRSSSHRQRGPGVSSASGSRLSTPASAVSSGSHSSKVTELAAPMRLSDLDWVRLDRGNADNLCGLGGVSPAPGTRQRGVTPSSTPLPSSATLDEGRNVERLQVAIPGETIGEVAQVALREQATPQPHDEPGGLTKEMISGLAATIADKAVAQVQLERLEQDAVNMKRRVSAGSVPKSSTPNSRYSSKG